MNHVRPLARPPAGTSDAPAAAGGATCDVLVVGGGINGAGIARDLAGRGLKVVLCEKDDLASHTSSSGMVTPNFSRMRDSVSVLLRTSCGGYILTIAKPSSNSMKSSRRRPTR